MLKLKLKKYIFKKKSSVINEMNLMPSHFMSYAVGHYFFLIPFPAIL